MAAIAGHHSSTKVVSEICPGLEKCFCLQKAHLEDAPTMLASEMPCLAAPRAATLCISVSGRTAAEHAASKTC